MVMLLWSQACADLILIISAGAAGDRIVRNVAAQQAHGHGFDPQDSDKSSMVGQASSSSSGEAETWGL